MDLQQLSAIFNEIGIGVISNSVFEFLKTVSGKQLSGQDVGNEIQKIINTTDPSIKLETVINILLKKGIMAPVKAPVAIKINGDFINSQLTVGRIVGFDTGIETGEKSIIQGSEFKIGEFKK